MCGKINPLAPLSPSRKAWMFLCLLSHPKFARKLGTLVTEGYLARSGWVRSVLTDRIVDADGNPVPWMSRPFIDFIEPRLHRGMNVFEYGSGASTLFLAQRVGQVFAVEDDIDFASVLMPQLPVNAQVVVHGRGTAGYIEASARMNPLPQLVFVDGSDRVECATASLSVLAADAVLILDDSELPEYSIIREKMNTTGFRALDFWGIACTRVERRCTTIFYRDNNALGI